MVVALGPGKFYGSSLPRPRIYTDVKFNSGRVDPPVSVIDPFMSWAEEAHWSMGGLSLNRHRLQGCIEGNVDKLRNQIENSFKEKESLSPEKTKASDLDRSRSLSPPAAPLANKRKRRYVGLVDDGEEKLVRKLADEFDLVASDKKSYEMAVEEPVKKKRLRKVGGARVSPRVVKDPR